MFCRQALGSIILHCKAPFGPKSDPSSTPADAAGDDDRASLQDASSDLTGRLQELHDPRSAGSFQRGQLDLQVRPAVTFGAILEHSVLSSCIFRTVYLLLNTCKSVEVMTRHDCTEPHKCATPNLFAVQDLVLNAGQVVEVPASDYVSTTSGGDQAKSSQIKGSSVVLDKTPPDFESYALTWKVQVSDLQVAFLSTRWLGTAQFVADDCNISHSIKNATEYTDVRSLHSLLSMNSSCHLSFAEHSLLLILSLFRKFPIALLENMHCILMPGLRIGSGDRVSSVPTLITRHDVQALASNAALYIMSHDVDMQNPVCWLEKGVSGYSLPDMEQQVNPIRLCVQPCQLQFRSQAAHAKSELDTNTKNNPVQYLHMKVRAHVLAASVLGFEWLCS